MSQEYSLDSYEMESEVSREDIGAVSQKYLIFVTEDLKFGVNVEFVKDIIHNLSITYLPRLPEYIRGIINLRGQIIPIVDIRLRLGKMEKEDNDLVIVLEINGVQIGLLVDSVDQMIDIPDANILPVPEQRAQQMVSGMCTLPGDSGTIMVLDCMQLLDHE